jgi:hypothetical protein
MPCIDCSRSSSKATCEPVAAERRLTDKAPVPSTGAAANSASVSDFSA